jgi:hypothetical protein
VTIEEAIRSHLVSEVPSVAGRVDPFQPRASATFPLAVYKRVFTEEDYSHDGFSGYVRARFQLEGWGSTYSESKSIGREMKEAFRGYSGIMGGASGVGVGFSKVRDEVDAYQPDLKKNVCIVDVELLYSDE